MIYIIAALILILLAAFVFFASVTAITEYDGKKFNLTVKIGFIKIKMPSGGRKKTSEKPEKPPEKEKRVSLKALKALSDKLLVIMPDVKELMEDFKKKIKCTVFVLDIKYDIVNAAECGIANGILWSAWGFLYPVLQCGIEFASPQVNIVPKFNNTDYFSVYYKGIYKLKIIHILLTLKYLLRIRKKFKQTKGMNENG